MGCGDVEFEFEFKFESEFGIAEWVVFADWIGEVSLIMLGSLELDRGANGLGEVRRGSSKVICVGRLCDASDAVSSDNGSDKLWDEPRHCQLCPESTASPSPNTSPRVGFITSGPLKTVEWPKRTSLNGFSPLNRPRSTSISAKRASIISHRKPDGVLRMKPTLMISMQGWCRMDILSRLLLRIGLMN